MKPGYKTTEFWLSLAAAIVGALLASGAFEDGSAVARLLGVVASALAAIGYAASRGFVKANETRALAMRDTAVAIDKAAKALPENP